MELAAAVGQDDRWVTCLFDRIVCGVDGSPSSRIAVAQARRVATPGAIVDLVSIVERSPDGWPRHAPDEERQYYEAQLALEAARERAAPSGPNSCSGRRARCSSMPLHAVTRRCSSSATHPAGDSDGRSSAAWAPTCSSPPRARC